MDAQAGELVITSQPQHGTTVSVFFPIGAPVPPSSADLRIVAKEALETGSGRRFREGTGSSG